MSRSAILCALSAAVVASSANAEVLSGSSNITETGQVFTYTFSNIDLSDGEGSLLVQGLGDYSIVPPSSETMTWDIDGIASGVGFGADAFDGTVDLFQNAVAQAWSISAADMAAITADGSLTITLTNSSAVNYFTDQPEDFLGFTLSYTSVPAPTGVAMLGLAGLVGARRRR